MTGPAGPGRQRALAARLRAWTRSHDPHVRAAVDLLIDHDVWLRRADFTDACVRSGGGEAWIDWRAARAFAGAGTAASTSEMAILDLTVALGENRYRLSIMGAANSRLIAAAVARAAGVQRLAAATATGRSSSPSSWAWSRGSWPGPARPA